MSTSWKLLAVGALVVLATGYGQYAHGATLPVEEISNLANGGTFAADGLQFTVATGCSANGTGGCSGADIEVAFDGSRRGAPTIEFLDNGSGNPSAALSANHPENVSFTLTIAPVAVGQPGYEKGTVVYSVSNAITGNANGTAGTNVFADVSCVNTSVCGTNPANANLSVASSAISFAASSQSITLSINLGLTGNNGTTLTLATDALHFSPAPEPASIALFVSGLAGLTAIRRRFKPHRLTAI